MRREPPPHHYVGPKERYEGAKHLWENEESLKKYLKKLKELMEPTKDLPRRICMDLWTPAEKAIHAALQEVEKVGADTRLTMAGLKLTEAQRLVADFVDGKDIL